MTPDLRVRLDALGRELSPALIGGTQAMFVAANKGLDPATRITRDHAYGPDARHRLDLFVRAGLSGAPVLLFVHGGGFVMGDKHTEGSPFYSNIGDFAARCGMLGACMTYRLAPEHKFPAGPDDVAAAVDWLRAHAAAHGGDPARIVLMGQSAGAALMSGIYDTTTCHPNDFAKAYYGDDQAGWGAASCVAGLLASPVPIQFSVAEFDPEDFHRQAGQIVTDWVRAKGVYPEMHFLAGHNHLSPALSIGSDVRDSEAMVSGFVRRVA